MVAHCSFCKATSLIDKGYATEKRKQLLFIPQGTMIDSLIILRKFEYAIIKALVTQMGGKFGAIFNPSSHGKVKRLAKLHTKRENRCLALV